MTSSQSWIPLESNPMVLNKYVYKLGMDRSWSFVDVYGFDPELLAFLPQPVVALVLLYPCDKDTPDQLIGQLQPDYPSDLYFTKQTIPNACGTVAVVHTLANNSEQIPFDDSSHFKTFLQATQYLSPEERAQYLEDDLKMGAAHDDCAQEGDTEAPDNDDLINGHFITFIHFKGDLYELDGNKAYPVLHGKTTPETFLEDAVEVVKKFMARDPDSVEFNVIALAKDDDW